MYEKIKFNELFKNKQAAVICYLSLERKYLNMVKYYRQICKDTKQNPHNKTLNLT